MLYAIYYILPIIFLRGDSSGRTSDAGEAVVVVEVVLLEIVLERT